MKGTPFIAAMLFAALNAWAGVDEDVVRVRQEWERIKYQTRPRNRKPLSRNWLKSRRKSLSSTEPGGACDLARDYRGELRGC